MHTANDSPAVLADRGPVPPAPAPLGDRLSALFDKVWPHLAAWGLAALLAFFAVRERLTLMETHAQTMLERIKALEDVDRRREIELREFREAATEIRTMLGVLVKADDERRAEERATWRRNNQGDR